MKYKDKIKYLKVLNKLLVNLNNIPNTQELRNEILIQIEFVIMHNIK